MIMKHSAIIEEFDKALQLILEEKYSLTELDVARIEHLDKTEETLMASKYMYIEMYNAAKKKQDLVDNKE